jgi:hypothetical protein
VSPPDASNATARATFPAVQRWGIPVFGSRLMKAARLTVVIVIGASS